jgi:hypothetical protein
MINSDHITPFTFFRSTVILRISKLDPPDRTMCISKYLQMAMTYRTKYKVASLLKALSGFCDIQMDELMGS